MERIGRPSAEFPDGIGLGIASQSRSGGLTGSSFPSSCSEEKNALAELIAIYRIAVARIKAQVRADEAVREQAALETRQVWLDSLLADRWKVQEIMDHQARALEWQTELPKHFEVLSAGIARKRNSSWTPSTNSSNTGWRNPIGSKRRSNNSRPR